jgi:chromosome partitioning protein
MRIRRKDREAPKPPKFSPFDQDTSSSEEQGPTSTDPVKSLIAEPPPQPVEADGPSHIPSEPPTDEIPAVAPLAAGAPVLEAPRHAREPVVADTPPPSPEPTAAAPPTAKAAPPTAKAAPPASAAAPPPSAAPPAAQTESAVAPGPEPALDEPRTVEPEVAAHTAMRSPTIRDDANELLNGAKPTTHELPRVIAIANQKGGVGKTTTTVNLGAALAEQGYRVLVVDLDPQGNATTGLGVDARNFELSMYDVIMRDQPLEDCIEPTSVKNLFVAPATIDLAGVEIELVPAFSRELKLKRAVDTIVDDFDFVLIDCPPSLGLITVNGLAAADEVLVPIQCEYYALEGLSQLLRNVNLVSTNLNETLEVTTIVLTMYDARTRLSVDVANEVRAHFSERVCRVVIPRTVRLSEAPSFGQPITTFDPASRGAVAYRELAKEVSDGAPQRTR